MINSLWGNIMWYCDWAIRFQVFSLYADKNVPAADVQLRTLRTAENKDAGTDAVEVS